MNFDLMKHKNLFVQQKYEIAEFVGLETRNKYQISDVQGRAVAFAAEQSKGFLGLLVRQFLGHWRRFEIHFFNSLREPCLVARHPFRFWFKRLEVLDSSGKLLGAIQQRFALFSKRFDIEGARGETLFEVSSPIWKIWTFNFMRAGRKVASIQKKWSGVFSELLTDKDSFMLEFGDSVRNDERSLILVAALFVDLQYFEKKA